MAWTDKMVEELKKLWNLGITTGEIGKRLGISKNSIVGKVHRLGLEGRPSPIKKTGDDDSKAKPVAKNKAVKKTEKKEKKVKSAETKEVKAEPEKKVKKEAGKDKKVDSKKEEKAAKTKDVDVKVAVQIEEEDIKLIKELEAKSDKDSKKENISLTELDNHTCRWPLGDPKDVDFHFCGRKVKTGQTYCEEHAAIAYVKPVRK